MLHRCPARPALGAADDLVPVDPQVGRGLMQETEVRAQFLLFATDDRGRDSLQIAGARRQSRGASDRSSFPNHAMATRRGEQEHT